MVQCNPPCKIIYGQALHVISNIFSAVFVDIYIYASMVSTPLSAWYLNASLVNYILGWIYLTLCPPYAMVFYHVDTSHMFVLLPLFSSANHFNWQFVIYPLLILSWTQIPGRGSYTEISRELSSNVRGWKFRRFRAIL